MKRYMHVMSAFVLLMSFTCHDMYALRRNTLRLMCVGFGFIVKGVVMASKGQLDEFEFLADPISIAAGLTAGSGVYNLVKYITPEGSLERANEALETILEENVIATRMPQDKESCFAMLQGVHKGDLWLFNALHKLQSAHDELANIMNSITDTRKKAWDDIVFVAQCNAVRERAAKALQCVGVSLVYVREALEKQSKESYIAADEQA